MIKRDHRQLAIFLLVVIFALTLMTGFSSRLLAEPAKTTFVDVGWDSIRFHNAVVGFIGEAAYGLQWEEISATSPIAHEALKKGEVDVHMEEWTSNLPTYDADLKAGLFQELGLNFGDNNQGLYVPRYVIEGDPARGIKPLAPDLKTVQDLKKYKDIFPDEEKVGMGRIYGAIPGWEIDQIMYKKVQYYGLDQDFIYFRPGSQTAMDAAFTAAYEKGKPIVGYYWEPTWLTGKYDLVLLEDAPYDPLTYPLGQTACPSVPVTTACSLSFAREQPEYVSFIAKYHTSSQLTAEGLAHMQDSGDSTLETAKWFLRTHDELLDQWLPMDRAQMVRGALEENQAMAGTNWFLDFPLRIDVDLTAIDQGFRTFAAKYDVFFGSIKSSLTSFVTGIQALLDFIPWWLLLGLVFVGGWKLGGKLSKGITYAVMLFLIGLVGFWPLMNETLAIVLASVVVSLVIGLPLGILVSNSEKANRLIRPVLDTMQTMPVFVYLIPAMLFFGLGKAPAVIATTIYAVVPVIRLTSLGIRQVDAEVVEAARAFGSTGFQTLWKVQIPQALPTIMTGVNQTLMMAMSMVVTCSMIGATGLGMEVLIGVNRGELGRGLFSGTAVVIIAILLDRLTQGWFKTEKEEKQ